MEQFPLLPPLPLYLVELPPPLVELTLSYEQIAAACVSEYEVAAAR